MLKIIFYIVTLFSFCSLKAQTFSGTGTGLSDNSTTCFSIPVSGVGIINGSYGLSQVCININHPQNGDLEIILTAPDGSVVPLSLQNGGRGSNYTATCFTATATRHITKGTAPFSGIYDPQGYLGSVNNGQNANGNWTLCIRDAYTGNTGSLSGWSIGFTNQPAPPLPPCYNNKPAGISCQAATPVCNFNGFCGNTSNYNYTSNSWAQLNGAFCATIDNNSFISFVASAPTESFKVYVTKSQHGGGIQLLFFSGPCGSGPLQSHGCYNQVPPGSGPTLVTATGLLPGSQYYLMVDGYAGDDCEYTFVADSVIDFLNVTSTNNAVCNGDSVSLSANGGNGIYTWSPATGLSNTTGPLVKASPAVATTYTVSCTPAGHCPLTAQVTVNTNAAHILGNDTSIAICSGGILNLTSIYNTTGFTSNWSLGGSIITNPSAISTPGIYQLIVSNLTGCTDTVIVAITITTANFLGTDKILTVAPGGSTDLTAQFITNGLNTVWTFAGSPVVNPTSVSLPGIYQLVATTPTGCVDTALATIISSLAPILGPDKLLNTCTGISADLTKVYNTSGLTVSWTIGGLPVNNPSTVSTAGTYQLVVLNSIGYADTALVLLVVHPNPLVSITNPAPVCAPATINLTAHNITAGSAPGLTYSYWINSSATISYPTPTVAADGIFFIKGTDANGCFTIKQVNGTVYAFPLVHAGNDTAICYNTSATLNGSISNASVAASYVWNTSAGIVAGNSSHLIVTPPASTLYILSVQLNYGICTATAFDSVMVNILPRVPAFAGNDTNALYGGPLQLQGSGGIRYTWSPAALLNNSNIAAPIATLFGDTRLVLSVADIAGCTGYDTLFIKILNGPAYYLPTAFSPNGDGVNDLFRPVAVGVQSTKWFRVFNRQGQLVFESTQFMKGWDGMFAGKKQPSGNYVWIIRGQAVDGKIIEKKGNVLLVR